MKKLVKVLVGIVVVLVVLVLALVLTLPFTIGPIVKTAAAVGGPKALGVPVSVGDVKLSPLAGSLVISQVKVGNPKGYSDKNAFAVDKVEVGLNLKSLLSDTIVVKKIQIDAPAITFESKDGQSNFDALLSNAKKSSEAEKAKKPEKKKAGKKVIIEEFTLNSGKVSYASGLTLGKALTIPLPSLTVRDIGKASGGTTAVDALTEVINGILNGLTQAVTGAAGAAGDLLKGLGGSASGVAKGATEALKGAAGGATDALKGATGGATDAAAEAVKAAENAAKSAGDAAKKTTDKLKKLFK